MEAKFGQALQKGQGQPQPYVVAKLLILDNHGMFYALEQFISIFLISPISISRLAITLTLIVNADIT